MKKHLSLFILALCTLSLFAQSNDNEDGVVKIEHYNRNAYREGQVIVKFRPESAVRMRRNAQGKLVSASVNKVTDLLNSLGFDEADELMPLSGNQVSPRKMRAFNGEEIQDKNLSKLYCFRASKDTQVDMYHAIEQLQALDEVEFAEPNYIVYALASDSGTYVSEPLYSQQWGPAAIGLPALWDKPKITTKRPVIAIIDTGVDIEHPDLAANIWTNEKEANGVDGEDDDNNGFVDDIHGWDFVDNTSRIYDYNGHGTHCAGIAAAVGDNGIGITGANPNALIMPITVMPPDGAGDIATVIKGIDYATANGADVISMSLGSYAYSIALEQSLAKTYSKAVLVAAAGNDEYGIEYCQLINIPMFPAAFQFVLGVQASMNNYGTLTSWSNIDCSGPIYSPKYSAEEQLYNYELTAPGSYIISTYPKGRYRSMAGTSMACPLVAGAISRLLQCKEYVNRDILFSDIIHSAQYGATESPGNMNIMRTYSIEDTDRVPNLTLVSLTVVDTLDGDGDGVADAGECIELYPMLRNDWGIAKNIAMSIKVAEMENDTLLSVINQSPVDFGRTLGPYAKNVSLNPIVLRINPYCSDNRTLRLVLKLECNDSIIKEIPVALTVKRSVELGGIVNGELVLRPGVQYRIIKPMGINKGATLHILPGATIDCELPTSSSAIENLGGKIIICGKPDSLISFTGDHDWTNIAKLTDTIKYTQFSHFIVGNMSEGHLENCILPDPGLLYLTSEKHYILEKCNLYGNPTYSFDGYSTARIYHCNITEQGGRFKEYAGKALFRYNNFGIPKFIFAYSSIIDTLYCDSTNYLGTSSENLLKAITQDYNTGYGWGIADYSSMRKQPYKENHGIVWKVVVNGYDAQDEFEQLPPLGVGRHKFEVYFNRAMDTLYTPTISMGVRSPYTQISIAEDGHWSADSTIYTAYLNLTGSMATDGLCRIYVADAKDNERFDIPTENTRFNVQVSAAGSMSAGFMAQAGLGKVYLEWNDQDANIADVLGYNMYRYTVDTLGQPLDTIRINHELIDDTLYTDFDVTPGTTYYYYYKVLRTDLQENSPSHTVAGTPLTASRGDANGSMTVDVADVVTEIAYLTNDNPQPFIFEAADVNSDSIINILDVVGTINIIIHPQATSLGFSDNNTAIYTIEDGILYVETPVVLGGVQFTIIGDRRTDSFQPLEALQGFEQVSNWTDEETYTFLAYSMSGKTLGIGKHALLRIGDAALEDIVLSNPRGQNIPAIQGSATAISVAEAMQMQSAYPNPFTTEVMIPYIIGQTGMHNVHLVFTNVAGLVVDAYSAQQTFGEYTYTWRPAALPAGVYFVTLYVDDKALQVAKLVRAAK